MRDEGRKNKKEFIVERIIKKQKTQCVIVFLGLIFSSGCITLPPEEYWQTAVDNTKKVMVKKCPECLRVYNDAPLTDCPYDGARLGEQLNSDGY